MSGERWACELCDREDLSRGPVTIDLRLITWAGFMVAKGNKRYARIPRCIDVQACRARVEARGGRWPLDDLPSQRTFPTVPARQSEELPL